MPSQNLDHPWNSTALAACEQAKTLWVQATSRKAEGVEAYKIEYARDQDEDPSLVERADAILHQPGDSLPHDDHLHVRVFCAGDDRAFGCVDRGPVRWWKKRYKYMPPVVSRAALEMLADLIQSVLTLVL